MGAREEEKMISSRLPLPIDLSKYGEINFLELLDCVYKDYFKNDFMNQNKREKLHGKFIFLDMRFYDYKPERFWHILSYKASDARYTLFPCVNTIDFVQCASYKEKCSSMIGLPNIPSLNDRCECLYRLKRVHWINPIIKYANKGDECIKEWSEEKTGYDGKIIRKKFIRYTEGMVDYVVILLEPQRGEQGSYKFVTAYPIVHKGTSKNLEDSYKEFNTQKSQS